MKNGKIGTYTGKKVYKVPQISVPRRQDDCIYAVAETGEMIYQGKVIASLNWNNMIVEDLKYPYDYDYSGSKFSQATTIEIEAVETDVSAVDLKETKAKELGISTENEEEFEDLEIPEDMTESDDWLDFDFSNLPTIDMSKYSKESEEDASEV